MGNVNVNWCYINKIGLDLTFEMLNVMHACKFKANLMYYI